MSNTITPEEWMRRARKMQTAIDDAGMGPSPVFTLDEAGVERLARAVRELWREGLQWERPGTDAEYAARAILEALRHE